MWANFTKNLNPEDLCVLFKFKHFMRIHIFGCGIFLFLYFVLLLVFLLPLYFLFENGIGLALVSKCRICSYIRNLKLT